jgi:hypothetical protein
MSSKSKPKIARRSIPVILLTAPHQEALPIAPIVIPQVSSFLA